MMEAKNKDYVTGERFDDAMILVDKRFTEAMVQIDKRFDESRREMRQSFSDLKQYMMDGFGLLDRKIDYVHEELSGKIDELAMTKADKEEVFALHKRVSKIEKKMA